MLNFVTNLDPKSAMEANLLADELHTEILRRYGELEQRAQTAEKALEQGQQVAKLISEVRKLGKIALRA